MVVVAVIVHDRLSNIEEWIRCWKQCNTQDAELVIIHNYKNEYEKIIFLELCQKNNIKCISRVNTGYDIGAFQDVCRDRLEGFPKEFDYLLWCTDDTLPMDKEFIPKFLSLFTPDVSCVCYEISEEIKTHVRTTGFMVRRNHLPGIVFKDDPITTKEQCYHFEHRDRRGTFYDQLSNLGRIVQIGHPDNSVLWDTGHESIVAKKRKPRRNNEHLATFPKEYIPPKP